MEPTPLTNDALPDDLAERISARHDGELTPEETAEVDRLLASDPVARRYAEDLRGLSRLCHGSAAPVTRPDLSVNVVAEALRRQAATEAERPQPVDRLEPEGDFGLPFGKSSQNWAWAGVAAAAAVVIFLNGRGDRPSPGPTLANSQPRIEQRLDRLRRAVPNMQVVNHQATPDQLRRLYRRLAQQATRPTTPPGELMTVGHQAGVAFQPASPSELGANGATEEVLCVEEAELDRLLHELNQEAGDSVVRVEGEGDRPKAVPTKPKISGLWRVQAAGNGGNPPAAIKPSPSAGRRFVVLRIRLVPKAPAPKP